MKTRTSNHLRLFNDNLTAGSAGATTEATDSVGGVCQAFARATGWSLRCESGVPAWQDSKPLWSAAIGSAASATPGYMRMDRDSTGANGKSAVDLKLAGELAGSIARLIGDLYEAREQLRKREGELAMGVPVVERSAETTHVADRLEAVLRGGAEAVGCHAAAIYLLDSATTELKLRSAWGLPHERLTMPPRQLRSSTADLEALVGHAVVMKNRAIRAEWNAPEAAASAVCVPISTATMPLGTLWMFSARERAFSDADVNLIEIVAGRVASDLEREVLMREGLEAATFKRQLSEAERLQDLQSPRVAPQSLRWDVDAWTLRGERLGGDFYDWFPHGEGALSVALGATSGQGVAAAMLSGVLRTAIRAHAVEAREPQQLIDQANRDIWQAAAGLQSASLFYAILDPTGCVRFATAGDVHTLLVRPTGWQSLDEASLALACDPATRYQARLHTLKPDEVMVVTTCSEPQSGDEGAFDSDVIARLIAARPHDSARQLAATIRLHLAGSDSSLRHDRTILVIKGRRPEAE